MEVLSANEIAERCAAAAVRQLSRMPVTPTATYRLQLHPGFTFDDAARVVPYLARLGISHLYLSPCFRARRGSPHGYDVCDHAELNEELGGEKGFHGLVASLRERGMGILLDVVPNHMAADPQNPWWNDVLENGPNSPYSGYFDIDWQPVKDELANKVLLPILGTTYGEALESGQLRVKHHEGGFFLGYFDHELPLGPKTALPLLTTHIDVLAEKLGSEAPEFIELQSIITALEHLPSQTATWEKAVAERQREKEVIKRRLRELEAACPAVLEFINENVRAVNGTVGDARSFDALERLLDAQPYRMCHWRSAADEINYRRFFDVNDLAAIATERPEVFYRTHQLIGRLIGTGQVDGLRIDHIDGLFAPEEYLWRLQWLLVAETCRQEYERLTANDGAEDALAWSEVAPAALREACQRLELPIPDASGCHAVLGFLVDFAEETFTASPEAAARAPLYVLAEKILGPDEPLPTTWPVAGTTGYDMLDHINGVLLWGKGVKRLHRFYHRFTGDSRDFATIVHDCKHLVLRVAMSSELQMLAHRLNRISEQHRRSRDFTLNNLRHMLRETLACFPVYRVYPGPGGLSERDRRFVHQALQRVRMHVPVIDAGLLEFVRDVLLLRHPPGLSSHAIREREVFAGRFQQVTSPVMAKGVEDTAFYVYVPLASINEVGGHPERSVMKLGEFHEENRERATKQCRSLIATTTHDTKRSEDVRLRIDALSEIPAAWQRMVWNWSRLNERLRRNVDGQPAPSRHDEYLFYQTLVGIFSAATRRSDLGQLVDRLQRYMEKATREAKQHTSWISPNPEYDEAVRGFVESALAPIEENQFLAELRRFCAALERPAALAALTQLVLKLTGPGVPDIYQGQELWDDSLVDPDNRRPVDFARRAELLNQIETALGEPDRCGTLVRTLVERPSDGRLKLLATWRLLQLRQSLRDHWGSGEYVPLAVEGERAEHVIAFWWRFGGAPVSRLLVAAPRWLLRLRGSLRRSPAPFIFPLGQTVWQDTHVLLPVTLSSGWKSIFTARRLPGGRDRLPMAELLADFPVAVLHDEPDDSPHVA